MPARKCRCIQGFSGLIALQHEIVIIFFCPEFARLCASHCASAPEIDRIPADFRDGSTPGECHGAFEFGPQRPEEGGRLSSVRLETGDALVFGGPSRLMWHSVSSVIAGTSPSHMLRMRAGRLNLTFRER